MDQYGAQGNCREVQGYPTWLCRSPAVFRVFRLLFVFFVIRIVGSVRGRVVVNGVIYRELSFRIIGAAIEVQRHLGPGFAEAVYRKALADEFLRRRIPFEKEPKLPVMYKGATAGVYRPDFVVDGIIMELKALPALLPCNAAQVLNYLTATGLHLALLLNFGVRPLGIRRFIK